MSAYMEITVLHAYLRAVICCIYQIVEKTMCSLRWHLVEMMHEFSQEKHKVFQFVSLCDALEKYAEK